MTTVPECHTSGSEDGDELVYHDQANCLVGQEVLKSGTASMGKGYFRTLCRTCRSLREGSPGVDPL